jgi:hypothetical protein
MFISRKRYNEMVEKLAHREWQVNSYATLLDSERELAAQRVSSLQACVDRLSLLLGRKTISHPMARWPKSMHNI